MAEQNEDSLSDFIRAVNGWKQAVAIMHRLRNGLQFTTDEMMAAKNTFPTDEAKAIKFNEAVRTLKTADRYLTAMSQPPQKRG